MASGKTTAGKKLASLFKTRFIDLDAYIEKKENRSIPAIFDEEGETGFRNIETHFLKEILSLKGPRVISLGGGTICFNSSLEAVKQNGLLIYLELPAAVLADRIQQSRSSRPLLKNLSRPDLLRKIEEILGERKKFYEQAHITINGLNLTPQLLYQKILGSAQEHIS